MKPARKRKLLMIVLILFILSLVAALVLYALGQNISLFYTPTQIATGQAPVNRAIRAGGMVVKDSMVRGAGLSVQFKITDFQHTVLVTYTGILPDLFREGQGIVAKGELLANKQFNALEILAKHDENYMPPEVKDALQQAEKAKL